MRVRLMLLIGFLCTQVFGQGINQAGGFIVFKDGAHLVMDGTGDYSNTSDGKIHVDTDGTFHLTGDWINSSGSSVFTTDDGTVRLTGAAQSIRGNDLTGFPTLVTAGSNSKTLGVRSLVGGSYSGTGNLVLNQDLILNSNTLILNNSSTSTISGTGRIISENTPLDPDLGVVEWNVDNQIGSYRIPFGTMGGIFIPVTLNVTTPGALAGDSAFISIATYPTNPTTNPNNDPLPSGTSAIQHYGREQSLHAVDRFWVLNSINYTSNPTGSLSLRYTDADWSAIGGSQNNIEEQTLRGINYNQSTGDWSFTGSGIARNVINEVEIQQVEFIDNWTLVDSLYCPDIRYTWVGNCVDHPIQFSHSSTLRRGVIDSIKWRFPDGTESGSSFTTTSFSVAGVQDVELVVYADNGCVDTLNQLVTIDQNALADFDYSTPLFNGLPTSFTNNSQYSDVWTWDLGDGETSFEEHPTHTYLSSGQVLVRLIAENRENCPDTVQKLLDIQQFTDFHIPNAFSPGIKDDLNNTFGLNTEFPIAEYHMWIYNRWGELVFMSDALDKQWDGKVDGEYVHTGTFLYRMSFRDPSGRAYYRNGSVSVLR